MSTKVDNEYTSIICKSLNGEEVNTRNSVCYRTTVHKSIFTETPLISVRKTAWKTALREWEWFMAGDSNIADLHESVHPWWKPWIDAGGFVKNNYSEQFRDFRGREGSVDQIALLIDGIKNHPYSRRNVITTWNTADMASSRTPITNCHGTIIQAFISSGNELEIVTYQRSVDVICGLPHNWLQYWAFLLWLSHKTGMTPHKLVWIGGDVHVYKEHLDLANKLRESSDLCCRTPVLLYNPTSEDFKADDFVLSIKYDPIVLDTATMVV